jgi:hypothetical protein
LFSTLKARSGSCSRMMPRISPSSPFFFNNDGHRLPLLPLPRPPLRPAVVSILPNLLPRRGEPPPEFPVVLPFIFFCFLALTPSSPYVSAVRRCSSSCVPPEPQQRYLGRASSGFLQRAEPLSSVII